MSMTSALPFDDFRALLESLPAGDQAAAEHVSVLFRKTGTTAGTLGRMEDIAAWLARWSGRAPPQVNRPLVAIFAGNHGVTARGISPRPMQATAQMVELRAAGGAAINQVCLAYDLGLKVFDLALGLPTEDITQAPALDERGCAATMAFGMEAVAGGTDLLCLGDLGVGNSTVAAAIFCMLYGGKGADWVGFGSGADAAMMVRKAEAVDAAIALHGRQKDPFEILRRVGGREFAACAGAIIAARAEKAPVILDGLAAIAAAAILHAVNPAAIEHCLLAQAPVEPGHERIARTLGLEPLLDLKMSHGEGTAAGLAAGIVKAAALMSSGMAAALRP
jgi:nicotinate-nucleotide--dimethylbenzimidazole phosphoribosyltransferase